MWEIALALTGTLGTLGALGAAALLGARNERLRLQSLRDVVELGGLHVESTSVPFKRPLRIVARAGSVRVRVEDYPGRGQKLRPRVCVKIQGPPGFNGVRIRPEAERPPGAREIEVGDERFDSTFYVEGPARLLSVLLDAETRSLLVRLSTEGPLTVAHGVAWVETTDQGVAALLPLLVDLARRFSVNPDIAERLAENARHDPVAGVRLRNLLVLSREFPNDADMVKTLRAACSDPSPQVRLRAGMALLGPEGRAALAEVAESLDDDACSAQAVAHLGRDLPFERTHPLLLQALRRRRQQTARACLESLGRSGAPAAVEALAKVLAVEKGDLATVAARALGETGSPAAEPPLLQALQHEKAEIRVVAAQALGRAGTAAAVLPLKEAAEEGTAELRRAARQAIGEIQSRLQSASPGQLSLAGEEVGRLSMANDGAGQLSLLPTGEAAHCPAPDRRRAGEPQRGGSPDGAAYGQSARQVE